MTSNEEILDSFIRHQTYVLRFAGGLRNEVTPYLAATEPKLMDLILAHVARADRTLTGAKGRKWQSEFEKALHNVRDPAWAKVSDKVMKELREFAVNEAAAGAATIEGAVPVVLSMSMPPAAQLVGIVNSQPFEGNVLKKWLEKSAFADVERISRAAKVGIVQGETPTQIARTIVGPRNVAGKYNNSVAQKAFRDIESVLLTVTNGIQQEAKQALYEANKDIVETELFVATLDSKTTIICMGLDGIVFPRGEGSIPPMHFRCLSGDTDITTSSAISNVYRRAYKGVMVNIRTVSGRAIKITPNHPVLTRGGWKAAHDINTLDQLVINDGLIDANDKNAVVAKFSDLFDALNIAVEPGSTADTPTTTEDFHGDFSNGEVKIIDTDSLSRDHVKSSIIQYLKGNRFIFGQRAYMAFTRLGVIDLFRQRHDPATGCSIGIFHKMRNLFRRTAIHSRLLLFMSVPQFYAGLSKEFFKRYNRYSRLLMDAPYSDAACVDAQDFDSGPRRNFSHAVASDCDSVGNQDSFNGPVPDSETLSDLLDADEIDGVEFDNVSDVFSSEFNGHVYNLENDLGWYCSNGIITHNCRSLRVAVIDPNNLGDRPFVAVSEKQLLRDYTKKNNLPKVTKRKDLPYGHKTKFDKFKRAELPKYVGTVPATTSYNTWLKGQTKEFQDDVLGPTRAKMFRKGDISLDRFTARNGSTLTLAELKAKGIE